MFEIVPALAVTAASHDYSLGDNEKWYIVKNMDNETTSPRGNSSLEATTENRSATASVLPVWRIQAWKLLQLNGKIALQNKAGFYLAQNMSASTTPFAWTLENVSQGGSSGYRFAVYTGNTLNVVAHLSTSLSLMNYSSADAASVWQFVPADEIKQSNEQETHYYHIQFLRYENSVIGTALGYEADNDLATAVVNGKSKWRITNYNNTNGSCNIMTDDGSYLTFIGTKLSIATTPKLFYIYLTNINGIVGYRISTATATYSIHVSLSTTKNLSLSTNKDQGSMWQFIPAINTPVVTGLATPELIFGLNGTIFSDPDTHMKVYTITGQEIENANLRNGLYLVETIAGVRKFLLK